MGVGFEVRETDTIPSVLSLSLLASFSILLADCDVSAQALFMPYHAGTFYAIRLLLVPWILILMTS